MWGTLLSFLGGPIIRGVLDAYAAKLKASGEHDKLTVDLAARELAVEMREQELKTELLVAEQGNWMTRWVRPAFALPFVIFTFKVIVWDKVLGLGTTDALDPNMWSVFMVIVGAYFGGRSIEKVARILKR